MFKKISLFFLLSFLVACMSPEKEIVGGGGGKKPPTPPVEDTDPLEKVTVVPAFANSFATKSIALPRIAAKFVDINCEDVCELKANVKTGSWYNLETFILTRDLWTALENEFKTDDKKARISYLEVEGKKVIVYFDSENMFFDNYSKAKGYASGFWKVVGDPIQDPETKDVLFEIANSKGENKKTWKIPESVATKIVALDKDFASGKSEFVILISDSKVVGLLINKVSITLLRTE
ncbi:MAG: hypothetical protein AB7O96_19970 [Pseudobdellovibrionaceae bacterium]